jgi:hypothetical protein
LPYKAKCATSFSQEKGCAFRATSDVAAVGDPNTGVAIFNARAGGWLQIGGTSAASPFVAGVYALTGHAKAQPSFPYAHTQAFFDVTAGSNGNCGSAVCRAGVGWDGPSGVGTPNGAALAVATE